MVLKLEPQFYMFGENDLIKKYFDGRSKTRVSLVSQPFQNILDVLKLLRTFYWTLAGYPSCSKVAPVILFGVMFILECNITTVFSNGDVRTSAAAAASLRNPKTPIISNH